MKVAKPFYSNCVMGYMHLYMRGNVKTALLCKGGNWLVPWHVVALTRKNRAIHFKSIRRHRDNRWKAWWHEGNWEVIPSHEINERLEGQRRPVLKQKSPHLIMLQCVFAWIITLPCYIIGFGFFPIYNAWQTLSLASRKRKLFKNFS